MKNKIFYFLFFSLIGVWVFAQTQPYRQIDPEDMVARQGLDGDIYGQMRLINIQTQADTVALTAGQTKDTVFLDNKYKDTDYMIFVQMRVQRGNAGYLSYASIALTDSSFEIGKTSGDSSWVQWMCIHK